MKSSLKMVVALSTSVIILSSTLAGCGTPAKETSDNEVSTNLSLENIITEAKQEGEVVSVGMPDTWANWKDTWNDITNIYGISHIDTDMSSAEEIAKFEAEKDKPTADIGDVGIAFAPIAVEKGVTLPYKTSYWDEIPDWAKDEDGNWIVGYTGTIAFITNKKFVDNPPKSWADILKGDYKVNIGNVGKAAQADNGVLAAAMALGGNESNIEPALDFFSELAKEGRLSMTDPTVANLERGEVEVGIVWDFNGLNYRDQIDKNNFDVTIPSDGSVMSGYATIINKYAPHPYAAMLTREFILSDKGQINLAEGYARPIRSNVELPSSIEAKLLPDSEYKNAKPINDYKVWEETEKQLPQLWQEKVQIYMK